MSLTRHLKTKNSPVRQFIHDRFSNTRGLTNQASAVIKGATTIRPSGSEKIPSTIGGAIDYRVRYCFPTAKSNSLVAWHGAKQAATQLTDGFDATPEVVADSRSSLELNRVGTIRHPSGGLVANFFEDLDGFLADAKPSENRLDQGSEETLARYCYVLALFEEVFRAGPWPTSILFQKKYQSVDELLDAVPSHLVDDVVELANIFYDRFESQLSDSVTLNPRFEGSSDVSGADGDLILNRCLIDFKATINPKLSPDWLRQLAGYVLLDYSDVYQLKSVGIYLIRQDILLQWSMEEFIKTLSGGKQELQSLRKEFQEITQTL